MRCTHEQVTRRLPKALMWLFECHSTRFHPHSTRAISGGAELIDDPVRKRYCTISKMFHVGFFFTISRPGTLPSARLAAEAEAGGETALIEAIEGYQARQNYARACRERERERERETHTHTHTHTHT